MGFHLLTYLLTYIFTWIITSGFAHISCVSCVSHVSYSRATCVLRVIQVDSGSISIITPSPPTVVANVEKGFTPPSQDDNSNDDNDDVPSAAAAAVAAEAFDFLSATFGSTLPRGQVPVVPSIPQDACTPLKNHAAVTVAAAAAAAKTAAASGEVGMNVCRTTVGAAVLVRRGGGCSFGVKAKNVQARKPTQGTMVEG